MMFGKVMSIPDKLIEQYYKLCTDQERTLPDPREAKLRLAKLIVSQYHGEKEAEKAEQEFIRGVSEGGRPSEVKSLKLKVQSYMLVDLLMETGMTTSKGEARRLIEQGGVKINDQKKTDPNEVIQISGEVILQAGKRNFLRLVK